MSPTPVLKSLVPWLLYAVLTVPDGQRATELAALGALAWALGSAVLDLWRHRSVKTIDACAMLTFAAYAIVGAVGSARGLTVIEDQGRGLAAAVLAAVMLVSAAVSPFTEQYAREDVPSLYWSSPVFRSLHRDLSIRWGVAMVLVAIGYLAAADLHAAQGSAGLELALNWALPAAAIAVAVRTTRSTAAARGTREAIRSGTP